MQAMVFQVSAKTARLIGRENISDVDGAIIELVKNGYDADAECVYIKYINPYDNVPKKLTFSEVRQYFYDNMLILQENYHVENGIYVLNDEENIDISNLEKYLRSLSKIIILDNGSGMSRRILESSWMNIGTDDKEVNIYSKKKKRIKTGAKGIGRFALDKLSLCTQVFTKCESEKVYKWEIDWTQFDKAQLLNQVEAKLEEYGSSFEEVVRMILKDDFKLVKEFQWLTGTLIILNPIRDFLGKKSYMKVNNNLRNINPLGSVDKFDIVVRNEKYPDLNFKSESEGIVREDYDYCIEASFDGAGNVKIILDRNEIDINKKTVQIDYSSKDSEIYELNEFWERVAFKRRNYTRDDFDSIKEFQYSLKEILVDQNKDIEVYNSVGPFNAKIYYLKNQKSTVDIIKDFKSRKRKQLLKKFSGIKIYRDNFKVRPYGDEGQFYDWINLSTRVQKSPAAASHESGNWRVSPNQLIGSISISRIKNPKLEDNANREGMSLNREYDCFIEIIQGILSKFEYDRQYVLREYAIWEKSKKKSHIDKIQQIYEQVKREERTEKKEKQSVDKESKDDMFSISQDIDDIKDDEFTKEDLKDAVLALGKEKENKVSTEQLMMVLSAAGVMAQTFSHEISRVATNLGSRGQHLREVINRLLDYKPYSGDEDFNPYNLLDELDSTDELLSEWVNLIMESVKKEKFDIKKVELKEFLEYIAKIWQPLLNKKFITIATIECDTKIALNLPEVDLHLIVNNFILNSAYYLEEADSERIITFKVYEDNKNVYLEMKNNGPQLDERYMQNPDETLNARVSSKDGGTGLGMWIAREAAIRNAGELHVIPIKDGYMLRASWVK